MAELGFYGKLPSHGDFVRRRVTSEFLDTWDAWLARCIDSSHGVLGGDWLDAYLTSPIWHFALGSGVS